VSTYEEAVANEHVRVIGTRREPRWKRFLRLRELPVVVALVTMLSVTGIANHGFLSRQGVRDILVGVSVVALLAVGETFVIVMRHVDLSVGSTVGFTAFYIGRGLSHGRSLPVLILAGIGIGAAIGGVNGALVALLKLPSLVVTLGSLYVVRGLSNQFASGSVITADKLPESLRSFGSDSWLAVPSLFWLVFIVALLASLGLRSLRSARDLYAIGSNPAAAGLVGIPTARRTLAGFVLCGAVAGLAGTLLLARFSAADANSGIGIELNVVAACVVGGVAIAGGTGTALGAVIGALLLQSITLALGALGVNQFWQQAVNGLLLICAIGLDRFIAQRTSRPKTIRVAI
jgi:rhamnose transport system permease protein